MSVIYWRDLDLPDFEVGLGLSSRHVFPRHWHEGVYLVGCVEQGESWCGRQGDESSLVVAGEMCLVNPGQIHFGIPVGRKYPTYRTVTVRADWFRDVARDVCQGDAAYPEFRGMVGKDPKDWQRVRQAIARLGGRAEPLEKQSLLVAAFVRLATGYCQVRDRREVAGREDTALRRAREFLSEDLTVHITLDDAARVAGFSRYHFLRVFKNATGLPPHVYRTQRRVEAARALLRKGLSFSEVALRTGFSDQSHFGNTFKKYTGATPGQYLRLKAGR